VCDEQNDDREKPIGEMEQMWPSAHHEQSYSGDRRSCESNLSHSQDAPEPFAGVAVRDPAANAPEKEDEKQGCQDQAEVSMNECHEISERPLVSSSLPGEVYNTHGRKRKISIFARVEQWLLGTSLD